MSDDLDGLLGFLEARLRAMPPHCRSQALTVLRELRRRLEAADDIVVCGNAMREAAVRHGMHRTEATELELRAAEDRFYDAVRSS